jgi:hypothetical protein
MGLALDNFADLFVDAMVKVPASYTTDQRHCHQVARLSDGQRPRTAGVIRSNPDDSKRHYEAAIPQSPRRSKTKDRTEERTAKTENQAD